MSLRKRIDRLAPKPHGPVTVFLTTYEMPDDGAETHRALIVKGEGRAQQLIREPEESEEAFRARIDAAKTG
jgi:hypothetical protein